MLDFKKEIEVKEGLRVVIETRLTDVAISVKETDNAVIEYHCNVNGSEIDPEDILAVSYDERKNEIRVEEKKIKGNILLTESRLNVVLPFMDEVSARNENNLLRVNNAAGRIRLENENGKIILSESSGSAEIVNENGMVNIDGFNGKQMIKTENGIIELQNCKGELKASSENGQVRILSSRQTRAEVKTENGSVFYHLPVLDRANYSFISENGKIHLVIPPGLSFDLEAVNENGSFHIGLPDNYETKLHKKNRTVKMVRGDGKVSISIKNENGSIDLIDEKTGKASGKEEKTGSDDFRGKLFMSIFNDVFDQDAPEKMEHIIKDKMKDIGLAFSDLPEEIMKKLSGIFNSKEHSDYSGDEKDTTDDLERDEKAEAEEEKVERGESAHLLQKILQMVEEGKITAEEADKLINTIHKEK